MRLRDILLRVDASHAGRHVQVYPRGGQAIVVARDGVSLYGVEGDLGDPIYPDDRPLLWRTAVSTTIPIVRYRDDRGVDTAVLRALLAAGRVGGEVVENLEDVPLDVMASRFSALIAHPRTLVSIMAGSRLFPPMLGDIERIASPDVPEDTLLFVQKPDRLGMLFVGRELLRSSWPQEDIPSFQVVIRRETDIPSLHVEIDAGIIVWASGAHTIEIRPLPITWMSRLMAEDFEGVATASPQTTVRGGVATVWARLIDDDAF